MAGRALTPTYISRTIRTNSIRRGLFGGSKFWMAVFAAGYVARWSGAVTKRGAMPVRFSEQLRPGEEMVIRHIDPSRRSG